jgi:hypothetical protein
MDVGLVSLRWVSFICTKWPCISSLGKGKQLGPLSIGMEGDSKQIDRITDGIRAVNGTI